MIYKNFYDDQVQVQRSNLKKHMMSVFLQCFDTVCWVIWPVETRSPI